MSGTAVSILSLSGVGKRYGTQQVLSGIDLTVAVGEKVILCGPSGSGKSTLIRCINGLETHDEGRIAVDGITLGGGKAGVAAVRRKVGMVFQHFNLFPHLTVLQNCTFGPVSVGGIARRPARELAMRHLADVRMDGHAGRYPSQLSGGQQQRVAIARALCMAPAVMLFDEPTSALDPEMVHEVLNAMAAMAAEGMTMLCVTHEMGFARRFADRMVFMDGGRIVEAAPTNAFFANPAEPRTRRFLEQILH